MQIIKSVIIPNSVKEIGNYAFYECNSITNIVLPSSLETIGEGVFCGCNLSEFIIPKNVEKLGYDFIDPYTATKIIFKDTNGWQKRYFSSLQKKYYGDWEDVDSYIIADSDAFKNLMKTKYTDSDGNNYYYQFQKV